MIQAGRGPAAPPPIGVVYNSSMTRPDAALALVAAYAMSSKNEARVGAVCVSGAGLDTAIFCDIVARVYTGPARNGNSALAVGLAMSSPLPPDAPMVKPAVDRKKDTGELQYARSIRAVSDTSDAPAVLRNGVTFNVESTMVLSAPATSLAKSMDILGSMDLYKQRVKRLVIVDSGAPHQDPAALNRVLHEWPTPIFYCGKDVGDALLFPGAALDKAFAWAPAHPVADAYRAFKAMPYDAPLHDVAALHYGVHPDAGFLTATETGTLAVAANGTVKFTAGPGTLRKLSVDPAKREQAIAAFVAMVSMPVVAGGRAGRGGLFPDEP